MPDVKRQNGLASCPDCEIGLPIICITLERDFREAGVPSTSFACTSSGCGGRGVRSRWQHENPRAETVPSARPGTIDCCSHDILVTEQDYSTRSSAPSRTGQEERHSPHAGNLHSYKECPSEPIRCSTTTAAAMTQCAPNRARVAGSTRRFHGGRRLPGSRAGMEEQHQQGARVAVASHDATPTLRAHR